MKIKIINPQIAKTALMLVPNEKTDDIYVDPEEKSYAFFSETVHIGNQPQLAYYDPNARKLH